MYSPQMLSMSPTIQQLYPNFLEEFGPGNSLNIDANLISPEQIQANILSLSQQSQVLQMYYNMLLMSPPSPPVEIYCDNVKLDASFPEVKKEQKKINKRRKKCSQYRGVFWNTNSRCWQARIMVNSMSKHLGFFDDEKDAAVAYDLAALQHRGESTFLNFESSKDIARNGGNDSNVQLSSKRKRRIADRTTPLRGVCWHKVTKKWKAAISIKGKYTHIGYFDDEHEAKRAYDEMAVKLRK